MSVFTRGTECWLTVVNLQRCLASLPRWVEAWERGSGRQMRYRVIPETCKYCNTTRIAAAADKGANLSDGRPPLLLFYGVLTQRFLQDKENIKP